MRNIYEHIDPLEDVYKLLDESISNDPPLTIKKLG